MFSFKMRNVLGRLLNPFVRGELRLFANIEKHLDLTLKSIDIIMDAIRSGDLHKIKDAEIKVSALENLGDEISHSIAHDVSTGAIATPIIGDVELMIGKIDDILDRVHILAREVRRAFQICANQGAKEIMSKDVVDLLAIDKNGIEELKRLVDDIIEGRGLEVLRGHLTLINKFEDMVDDAKDQLIDKLYLIAKDITYVEFTSLIHIVFTLDDIMDIAKDASYMILTILSSMGA